MVKKFNENKTEIQTSMKKLNNCDKQREEYWSKRNQLIGQLVEIRADAKTKSKDAVAFSLRFPRFKCFRGFKVGEKV